MSNSNDISQIRNLIFGTEMDKINTHFTELEARLAQMDQRLEQITTRIGNDKSEAQQSAQHLENSLNTAMSAIKGQVDALKKELIERLDKLQSDKTARDELADLFTDLAKRLNNSGDK